LVVLEGRQVKSKIWRVLVMKRCGFTLIELMIVIVIIGIILSIAIPSFMQARRNANETSAIGALRAIGSAEAVYRQQNFSPHPVTGMGQYGDLDQLAATLPPFVDNSLASRVKAGYSFSVKPIIDPANPLYTATAQPVAYRGTGIRSFYVDPEAVIRFTTDGTPAADSSPSLN
jgi:prepilin-type N-terminal cleavage/methylation domain-containing protein